MLCWKLLKNKDLVYIKCTWLVKNTQNIFWKWLTHTHCCLVISGLMGTGVFFMFHCVLLLPTGLLSVSPSPLRFPPHSTFQPHAHSLFPDIAHCLATSKGSILNMCPFKTVQESIASGPHYVGLLNRSHVAALIRTYMYLQCRQSTYLRGA